MKNMTAMILAAGKGVRMGERGKLMPKGMLEVGGRTLAEQSVDTLRMCGFEQIVIVTGHLAEQYEEMFGNEPDVKLVHNEAYATTGSLRTLATGLAHIDGAFVIIESDLLYPPQALTPLVADRNICIVSGPTGAGDEVYIWTKKTGTTDWLADISKDRAANKAEPLGEMMGLTGITAESVPSLRRVAAQILERKPDEHYELGLVSFAREEPVSCHLFPDLPWTEIDDEGMYARAVEVVYPRLAAARRIYS